MYMNKTDLKYIYVFPDATQALTAAVVMLLSPMNMNSERSVRSVRVLNHVVLAFSFGSMVVDTIKMVFVADTQYEHRPTENEDFDAK